MSLDPDDTQVSEIGRRRQDRRRKSTRTKRSDERWREILAGASVIFRRTGYAQATLDDVAREVGINRATLYYYVGTKEELLIALLNEPMKRLADGLVAAPTDIDASPPERLATALRTYVTAMAETPELFILLAETPHHAMSGPEADEIAATADRYGKLLTEIIREGVPTEHFRGDIPADLAMLGILGMFNWIHRWYSPDGPRSLAEIGDVFVSMALASLRPDA